jgi:hypothetical protein
MKLAKLLSGRPAAPSGALIRAMKWDVSAISVAVMSGATSSGSRIQESSKSPSKTIARTAEQKRRRELEEGFNNFTDTRHERIRTFSDVADDFFNGYKLRLPNSDVFAALHASVWRWLTWRKLRIGEAEKTHPDGIKLKARKSERYESHAAFLSAVDHEVEAEKMNRKAKTFQRIID